MESAFKMDEFSVDAVVFAREKISECDVTLERRVVSSLTHIEQTMDWYDHVAAAFLLIEDPKKALETIQAVVDSHKSDTKHWQKSVLTPLFKNKETIMWMKLIDVLFTLKHKKLLKFLEVDVHSSFKAENINQFRLKLFHIIDDLCGDKAQELVAKMNSKIKEPILDKSWSVEMHILKWIETGEISEQDDSKLLMEINSSPIPIPIKKSQRSSSELPNKVPSSTKPTLMSCKKCIIKNGLCIIINQMHFRIDPSLEPGLLKQARGELGFRYGSDGDRDKLSETFKMLGHKVVIFENLRYHQLHTTMKKVAEDFRQHDALVVCILSHGEKDSIFTSDCVPVKLDEIKSYFCGISCLVDKPKLFFLQACQGEENQTPVYPCAEEHGRIEEDGNPIVKALPSSADFFEGWATVPGYYSYRSTTTGAIFIRALCLVLQSCNHEECDLSDIMTMVNDKVAYWHSDNKKQMSCNNSSLTKKVHFQRQKDTFIEAIIDQLEREIMDKSTKLASHVMWNTERRLAYQIINSL